MRRLEEATAENMIEKKTCAITGHRVLPDDLNKNALYDALENLILEGYDLFLCGMAEGFDLLCLEMLFALKTKYRIFVEACVPYIGQEKNFSQKNKSLYRELIEGCEYKTVLSENYFNGCFLARDRYMVDKCDLLFAYCTKETGGAAYTVAYAKSKSVPIVFFGKK